jgi:AcrR family transcriptional regulator
VRVPKAEVRSRADKTEAQRSRILDAAQRCFAESGFHAATMATIAETAGISAGLAYRYFPSKDAIVLAIIDRQLELRRARIAALPGRANLVDRLVEAFRELTASRPDSLDVFNPALFLDMSAEATRVPGVAEAIACSDRLTQADFRAWLERPVKEGGMGLAPPEAQSQALLLQVFFEGMIVRAARDPGLDPERLRGPLEKIVGAWL